MDGLQIKQVAQETGLTEQVIRKWEQRYGAVHPRRLENGYRVYSLSDVTCLRQIQQLVNIGIPVSRAVEKVHRQQITSELGSSHIDYTQWTLHLLEAGERGELSALTNSLQRSYLTVGLRTLIEHIILPFLRMVGEKWQTKEWSEDQEHLCTQTVRDFLIRRISDVPNASEGSPMLLTACVPGERHDMMLQIASLEARQAGWNTAFLGPSPAPTSIQRAVTRLHPEVVLLSMSTREPLRDFPGELEWFHKLDSFASEYNGVRFFLGGPHDLVQWCTSQLSHIQPVSNLASWIEMLSTIETLSTTTVSPKKTTHL